MSIEKAYNSWAEQYDTNQNITRDLDAEVTKTVLSNYAFTKVLELGCGTGKNTKWLLTQAEHILGLDFSEEMLTIARKKMVGKNVEFRKADLNLTWEVETQFADLITSSLTLEHIKNLDHIFHQANQKLLENGLFFICELHPFKQYSGSKAKFENDEEIVELEVFTHHISDYLDQAKSNGFELLELKEWFDAQDRAIPRLISFVFRKTV